MGLVMIGLTLLVVVVLWCCARPREGADMSSMGAYESRPKSEEEIEALHEDYYRCAVFYDRLNEQQEREDRRRYRKAYREALREEEEEEL